MYYVEDIINGVLMYKTSPNGEWRPVSDEQVLRRMSEAEKKIYILRSCLKHCTGTLKSLKEDLPSFEKEIRGKIDSVLNEVAHITKINR